jgi:hypothetical protein
VVVLPVDELLTIVRVPLTAPAVVGANSISSVVDWPALSVIGNEAPASENPVPATVAEVIVTDAEPVALNVNGWVEALPSPTLPNATLEALTLRVGSAGFNCSEAVDEAPPALPVMVAV